MKTDKHVSTIKIMKKTLFQGIIIIAFFFSTWFVLTQINWVTIFNVKKVTDKNLDDTLDVN